MHGCSDNNKIEDALERVGAAFYRGWSSAREDEEIDLKSIQSGFESHLRYF